MHHVWRGAVEDPTVEADPGESLSYRADGTPERVKYIYIYIHIYIYTFRSEASERQFGMTGEEEGPSRGRA